MNKKFKSDEEYQQMELSSSYPPNYVKFVFYTRTWSKEIHKTTEKTNKIS